MSQNRMLNTKRNFIWNTYCAAVTSVCPFIIRTLLVHCIGIEYTGVSSLFTSVLQILNIIDLGFDSAFAFFFFRVMAERDYRGAGALLKSFRKLYRIVGVLILAVSVIIMPLLPYLVRGKSYPPDINIYVIFIVYVLNVALPYLIGSYNSIMIKADQRLDIVQKIGGTTALLMYVLQAVSIYWVRNYYYYTFLLLGNAVLFPLLLSFYRRKAYPQVVLEGKLEQEDRVEIKKRVVAVGLSKLRNISRNSFDSVIISVFLGLAVLTAYQNYYQVMLVWMLLLSILHGAIGPSLGNSVALESKEKNYGILERYSFAVYACDAVFCPCILNLYQPFIKIWMGEKLLLPYTVVILFCIYFYMLSVSDIAVLLREVTGVWWEGYMVAVVEAAANLVLNILLVKILGAPGVILATILTVALINIPLEFYYIFKTYFKQHLKTFIISQIKYALHVIMISAMTWGICRLVSVPAGLCGLFLTALLSVVIAGGLFLVLNVKNENLAEMIKLVSGMLHRKNI